jgi:hypothetical protein
VLVEHADGDHAGVLDLSLSNNELANVVSWEVDVLSLGGLDDLAISEPLDGWLWEAVESHSEADGVGFGDDAVVDLFSDASR